MEIIDDKYYKGFEGEPEIQFIKLLKEDERQILSIWSGYFDEIMEKIEPTTNGWDGLAYYYQLQEGWYEESPWTIDNIDYAIRQFNEINEGSLHETTRKVLVQIKDILQSASNAKHQVQIAYL